MEELRDAGLGCGGRRAEGRRIKARARAKDLVEASSPGGAGLGSIRGLNSGERNGQMTGARTSIEGTTCPLQGYPSAVALVDDGDRGTGKDFADSGEGRHEERVMLDR